MRRHSRSPAAAATPPAVQKADPAAKRDLFALLAAVVVIGSAVLLALGNFRGELLDWLLAHGKDTKGLPLYALLLGALLTLPLPSQSPVPGVTQVVKPQAPSAQ